MSTPLPASPVEDNVPAPPGNEPAKAESTSAGAGLVWGLSAGDRRFAMGLAAATLLLVLGYVLRTWLTPHPLLEVQRLESRQYEFQIDVNRAGWVEWMQLPGIGETLARQIVEDRETRGPFASIDDVSRVRGIGPGRMRDIRPYLQANPPQGSVRP